MAESTSQLACRPVFLEASRTAKKQERSSTTLVTIMDDIAAIDTELSDAHLRLVAGAARKCTWERCVTNLLDGGIDVSMCCADQA